MDRDLLHTSSSLHDLIMRSVWCVDCCRWHFRLSLRLRSESSPGQWLTLRVVYWDHQPGDDGTFRMLPGEVEELVRDLMRLEAEYDSGVGRLFY